MEALRKKYEALGPDASEEQIRLTAEALVRRQFMPVLILNVPDFFFVKKQDLLAEFDRVIALSNESEELSKVVGISDPDEVKKTHLVTLLNQYELLSGLRKGDGDAWATVNELYEDD